MLGTLREGASVTNQILPPCQNACPINQDVRGYIALIAQGKLDEALELIRETNPLPFICATICSHPCEDKCRRREVDDPLSIRGLKRFVVENAGSGRVVKVPVAAKTERVAIIGSGPAGLTAAHDLAMNGYGVTVFEKEDAIGGAIRLVVPEYRLPVSAIQRDVDAIASLGVEFKTKIELGRDITLDDLLEKEGYRAVLLSMGLPESKSLPIPGAELKDVLPALPFLRAARKGESLIKPGSEVIVVGGGNVAIDAARTARRFGAGAVRLVCLESRDEMPASPWEIEEALEEGIEMDCCSKGPNKILDDDGQVTGIECKTCLAILDEEGKFSPAFCEEDLSFVKGDVIILAVGQEANISYLKEMGVELNERGQLIYDRDNFTTSRQGVFACGEVITGPGIAVEAMARGREAASTITRYLEGIVYPPDSNPVIIGDLLDTTRAEIKRQVRQKVPLLKTEERQDNFVPIELGYTDEMALREARRCLSCGFGAEWIRGKCAYCLNCVQVCPYEVPIITESGRIDIRVDQCQACGICYSACPSDAISFKMNGVADIQSRMEIALREAMSLQSGCTILVLYCNFSIGALIATKERTGNNRSGMALVPVPCPAKIKAVDLLKAFEFGASGVLVTCCPAEECIYQEGDVWAQRRVAEAKQLLAEVGLDTDQLQLQNVTGPGSQEFDGVLHGFMKKVENMLMTKE